ncbi:hypothetical protein [uncultured Enterococcus sp.]|uniref:hypothetical protein n=1 Tax=uncultured Enterococcus sp. TaxID=167972 RepID=UPI002AA6DFA7|nr:hypothetical protein [uncultured Enterococcus sp.]
MVKPDIQLQEQQPPVSAVPNTVGPSAMEELADSAIDSHEIVEVVPDILRTTKLELDHVLTEVCSEGNPKN